jgi:hypothetical protein
MREAPSMPPWTNSQPTPQLWPTFPGDAAAELAKRASFLISMWISSPGWARW